MAEHGIQWRMINVAAIFIVSSPGSSCSLSSSGAKRNERPRVIARGAKKGKEEKESERRMEGEDGMGERWIRGGWLGGRCLWGCTVWVNGAEWSGVEEESHIQSRTK